MSIDPGSDIRVRIREMEMTAASLRRLVDAGKVTNAHEALTEAAKMERKALELTREIPS